MFYFFSLFIFSQEEKSTIYLFLNDCKKDKNDFIYKYNGDSIKFYQNKKIILKGLDNIHLYFLQKGVYKVEYYNIFKEKCYKEINIENNSQEVNLCIDELNEYPINSIKELNINDSIIINFKTGGRCFTTKKVKSRKNILF